MHPSGIDGVYVLRDVVRLRPVAATFMPQRLDKWREVDGGAASRSDPSSSGSVMTAETK